MLVDKKKTTKNIGLVHDHFEIYNIWSLPCNNINAPFSWQMSTVISGYEICKQDDNKKITIIFLVQDLKNHKST